MLLAEGASLQIQRHAVSTSGPPRLTRSEVSSTCEKSLVGLSQASLQGHHGSKMILLTCAEEHSASDAFELKSFWLALHSFACPEKKFELMWGLLSDTLCMVSKQACAAIGSV